MLPPSPPPLPTRRPDLLDRLAQPHVYDLAVIGGGATGLGVALDAAARGLRVVLLESHDFAHGTSSRSTKLLHGGVRYLAQGNLALVREALRERNILLRIAPHLAHARAFVVPVYQWHHRYLYSVGLHLYDWMAGAARLGPTEWLNPADAQRQLPGVRSEGLRGAVQYWDGQFNDARLALALARTAAQQGALLLNYCAVEQITQQQDRVNGLVARDRVGGGTYSVRAHCVVNATGVWVDTVRHLAGSAQGDMVMPSQGVHIVVDRSFLAADAALLVPDTADGRVLFMIPWFGRVIIGTTDTPRDNVVREPRPFAHEIDFLLRESARYLRRAPVRADIRSAWVGLRPLVRRGRGPENASATATASRAHSIVVSAGGLVTVTGGKWTTYRAMAEDVLAQCQAHGLLHAGERGVTAHLPLVGAIDAAGELVSHHHPRQQPPADATQPPGIVSRAEYGTEWAYIQGMDASQNHLGGGLTEAMVRFAARHEYAVRVEDVLARRARCLFLDAALAVQLAPSVGAILQQETGIDPEIAQFIDLATQYSTLP